MYFMNNKKLTLLFIFCCLPLRITEILLIFYFPVQLRIPILIITSVQTIGFGISSILNKEKGFFGEKRWWSSLFHFIFFGTFVLSFGIWSLGSAWIILAVDLSLGTFAWFIYHKRTETFF